MLHKICEHALDALGRAASAEREQIGQGALLA